MQTIQENIEKIKGVQEVLKHKDTETVGRWNIMTDDDHFEEVTATIQEHLMEWIGPHLEEFPQPAGYDAPQITFNKNPFNDDDSGITMNTYFSNCSTIYNKDDTDIIDAPEDAKIPVQEWDYDFIQRKADGLSDLTTPQNSRTEELEKECKAYKEEVIDLKSELEELRREISKLKTSSSTTNTTTTTDVTNNTPTPSITQDHINQMVSQAISMHIDKNRLTSVFLIMIYVS